MGGGGDQNKGSGTDHRWVTGSPESIEHAEGGAEEGKAACVGGEGFGAPLVGLFVVIDLEEEA